MMLANLLRETSGLTVVMEMACGAGCLNCNPNPYAQAQDYVGKRYCGRGYIQLVIYLIVILYSFYALFNLNVSNYVYFQKQV